MQEPSHGCTEPLSQRQLTAGPAPRRTTVKQEKEPHVNHTFKWCGRDKNWTNLTCLKTGSVEDSLRKSLQFQEPLRKNKNKDKELVNVRDGRAISSDFPCRLINDKNLKVEFIKPLDEPQRRVENHYLASCKTFSADKLVTLHVLIRGGDSIAEFLTNKELGKKFQEMSVYAVKGEKVRRALKRDGRFREVVFKKRCVLVEKGTEVRTEMLDLVDNLDGKTFKIARIPGPLPETPPESLEDAYVPQSESQGSACEESSDAPQQPIPTESVTDNREEKTERKGNIQPEMIPNSEMLRSALASAVTDFIKGLETGAHEAPHYQKVFREEFGKNEEACHEVITMKKMMELSDSVCLIRINGRSEGSGFLLFGNFVLTNGHVVKDVIDITKMTVHFSYTRHGQVGPGVVVEEVTGGEYGQDVSGHKYDWALLKISVDQKLPCPLLTHFGFLSSSGGICIIGHPEGDVKKVDTCWIIPTDKRAEVAGRHYNENPLGGLWENIDYRENQGHVTLVTPQFFKDVASSIQREAPLITYESCFYFGSSGSPVFDENCNVVAMHSGGFPYRNKRSLGKNSVIEFGYPLSNILEHIIMQMVERKRFDVLKEYLACSYSKHQNVMTNVKKLIESRNFISSFREAYTEVTEDKSGKNDESEKSDKSVRQFFEFFLQKEEPVSMDLSCQSFSTEVLREDKRLETLIQLDW